MNPSELPQVVKCHACGSLRNNGLPRDESGQPDLGIGWYSHESDRLIWCDECWIKEGFRRYHG